MVKHMMTLLGVASAIATLSACGGVSEEQHKKTLDELKSQVAAHQECQQAYGKLKQERDALAGDNSTMRKRLIALGEDVSKLQTETEELKAAQQRAQEREAMFKNLMAKFKSMIDAGKLTVETRNGRMIVKMSDQVLFGEGSDQLKKEGKDALLQVGKILGEIKDRKFQVAGHTDNIPIRSGRFGSNWELSAARAVNVVKYLEQNGMTPDSLSAAGYGPYDAIGDNATKEGRQQNRRIEITLMPNLQELPL